MQLISDARVETLLDLDYGEGWITFSWLDNSGIDRSLTIDAEGFCHREMPIRSGHGVSIVNLAPERICLRFTDTLASRLELGQEIEFAGRFADNVLADLRRLADIL